MKNPVRNASSMKLDNMLQIIDRVRRAPVSRADLARATGLTRAAITIIVDRLIREGILSEQAPTPDKPGSKPIRLDLAGGGLYFMGIDISRVRCSVCILDTKGTPVTQTGFPLDRDSDFARVLPQIKDSMRQAIGTLNCPEKLMGIGVSVPGPVDTAAGVTLNPPNFRMLQGQPVLDQLREVWNGAIWIENNAVARTLYEKNLGVARRFANFMVMIVDTGIGSGLVLDGKLYRGTGFAGEAGHTSIDIHGEVCVCGNRGCLELYAAIPALLRRHCADRPDIRSWADLAGLAAAGDEKCLAVIHQEAAYLAHSLVNTANLLDLEAVILTGSITCHPELLLDSLRRQVQESRITGAIHSLEILSSQAKAEDGAACAAMIALEKFLAGETGWNR